MPGIKYRAITVKSKVSTVRSYLLGFMTEIPMKIGSVSDISVGLLEFWVIFNGISPLTGLTWTYKTLNWGILGI